MYLLHGRICQWTRELENLIMRVFKEEIMIKMIKKQKGIEETYSAVLARTRRKDEHRRSNKKT